ncbi:hypothetical protein [Solicola gregarius]|uniref:Uncharacterized protein n=1 Tax=Solicola gregarius TaxID=2908642 RepID=A0AA46TK03_9ACTN|nr:hypothetical protein [Solicola gregarius]UYM06721.1 hypothetical protein L0C25_06525 [Solicola gregarius]
MYPDRYHPAAVWQQHRLDEARPARVREGRGTLRSLVGALRSALRPRGNAKPAVRTRTVGCAV